MTAKELSQLHYLKREMPMLEERIQQVQSQTERMTSIITDMPRGGAQMDLKDELLDLKHLLEINNSQCIIELSRLERYIGSIEDPMIRMIFVLRHIDGLSWRQIANKIGNNTEDSVRMAHKRYLAKRKSCSVCSVCM